MYYYIQNVFFEISISKRGVIANVPDSNLERIEFEL